MDDDDLEAVDPAEDEDEDERTPFARSLWFLGIVAVALAVFMKTFLIQAFFIPSSSMEETLHGCPGCTGDRVLVNKVVYKFRDIHRGEIVVFNGKNTQFPSETEVAEPRNAAEKVWRGVQSLVGLGAPGEKDFIKRVIGLPGDTVACCHEVKHPDTGEVVKGQITINGQPIDEAYVYLSNDAKSQDEFEPVTVPPGHLFVMGDHRNGSSDSRYHGTIPQSSVVGRAFAVFYPIRPFGEHRAKVLRVPDVFDPTKRPQAAPATPAGARVPAELLSPPVLGLAVAVPVTMLRRRHRRTTD